MECGVFKTSVCCSIKISATPRLLQLHTMSKNKQTAQLCSALTGRIVRINTISDCWVTQTGGQNCPEQTKHDGDFTVAPQEQTHTDKWPGHKTAIFI